MKNILKDNNADVKMIGGVVGILVTLIIAVLVFYNIAGSIDATDLDAEYGNAANTPTLNATDSTLDQASTFFTIAPIIAIVVVAVVILKYVGQI